MVLKLSTRGRYGLRAMIELARDTGHDPVNLGSIAESQSIPQKYLYSVLEALKVNGLVTATRGVGGGYRLARDPDEISVLDVVEAVEGPLLVVDCVGDPQLCGRADHCATRELWQETTAEIRRVLADVSLQRLAQMGFEQGKRQERCLV
jgi:Rrf2 family protein